MHLFEGECSCAVVSAYEKLDMLRGSIPMPGVDIYCIEAELVQRDECAPWMLMRLTAEAHVIAYGSPRNLDRKARLSLLSVGIMHIIDCTEQYARMINSVRVFLDSSRSTCREVSQGILSHVRERTEAEQTVRMLTSREREVLSLISRGETTKSIAYELQLSCHTVESYRKQISRKTGAGSIADMTRLALQSGITFLWE